jgi:predicted ferric reductase
MEEQQIDSIQSSKRPTFLTVLCILTFVFAGFATLSFILKLANGQPDFGLIEPELAKIQAQANQMREIGNPAFAHMFEKLINQQHIIFEKYMVYHLLHLIMFVVGLLGALFMFRGKKLGFHLYIIYSILYTFLEYIFFAPENVVWFTSISGLIISGGFVLMYSRNLKWLK